MQELTRALCGFIGLFGGIVFFDAHHEIIAVLFFMASAMAMVAENRIHRSN